MDSETRKATQALEKATTVLVVDDHPPFAQGLSELLRKQEDLIPVGVASDGEEAVRLAQELKPDIVVMDISMPKMNGIEATRAIKAKLPRTSVLILSAYGYYPYAIKAKLPRTSVLILSAYGYYPYVVSAFDAGTGGYLLKTAPMRDVIAAIRALRSGEAVLEHSVAEKLLKTVAGSLKGTVSNSYLTDRELQVLRLSAKGISNREIGEEMGVAERTVQAYLTTIFSKLGVGSRLEAVLQALKQGWLLLEDLP